MKKLSLMLLVMLSTFCFISMANVNAEGEYAFTVSSGAEGENNYFTMTGTRAYLDVNVEAAVTAPTYISIKFNASSAVENFDIIVTAAKEDGTTGDVLVAAEAPGSWNEEEFVEGEGFIISTIQTGNYLEGYVSISKVQLKVRGAEGATIEILDFAVTADGIHGFDTTTGGSGSVEPEQPEQPSEPNEFTLVPSDETALSITDNVVTLLAEQTAEDSLDAGAYVTIPVSNVDLTGVFVSVMYKLDGITAFGLHAQGVGASGDVSGYVANMLSGWNVKTVKYDSVGIAVATAEITSYVAEYTAINGLILKLVGPADATFEVLDFVVTTDGKHGFAEPVIPEEPDDGTLKFGDITTSATATITKNESNEQVISYEVSPGWATFDMTVKNYDINLSQFEISFTADAAITMCVSIDGNINWDLGHKQYAAGRVQTEVIDVAEYGLGSSFTIQLYLDAEATVEAARSITIHSVSFKAPAPEPEGMWLGTPSGSGLSCLEGENGYDISYNNDTASWRNVTISVNNHEVEYDVIRIKFNVTEKTNVGVYVTYLDESGAATDKAIRNHWAAEGVVAATGDLDLVFLLGAHIDTGKTITSIKVYFDNPTDFTTNTGDCTAKLLSYELLKSADLDLTDLEFSLEDATFDYTGESVELDVECAEDVNFRFEYSNANAPEGEEVVWNTGTPKNAGEYNIRVSFLGSLEYNYATITAKVTINKVKATVNADDVTVDAATRVVTVKDGIEASTDSEFAEGSEVLDGDEVPYGTVIYYRNAGDKNHTASDVLELKVERPVEDNPGEDNPGEDTPTEPGDDQPTEPGTGETPTPTPTPEKGCLGSVGASIIGVFALLGACLVAKRRKED